MRNYTRKLLSLKSKIENVTQALANLSLEVDRLIEEEDCSEISNNSDLPQAKLLTKVNERTAKKELSEVDDLGPPFKIGECVAITNNYKGLQG